MQPPACRIPDFLTREHDGRDVVDGLAASRDVTGDLPGAGIGWRSGPFGPRGLSTRSARQPRRCRTLNSAPTHKAAPCVNRTRLSAVLCAPAATNGLSRCVLTLSAHGRRYLPAGTRRRAAWMPGLRGERSRHRVPVPGAKDGSFCLIAPAIPVVEGHCWPSACVRSNVTTCLC